MKRQDKTLEDLFSLRGRTALVTGASSGLGVEFARALATAGADVAVVARRPERLREVADELRERGVRAAAVVADLACEDDVPRAVQEAEAALGPIDILVNNAGCAPISPAERHRREKWDQALALNLTAPFLLCQEIGRRMIERGTAGRIVNVTSVLAEHANPIYKAVGYVASKAGLANLTRQLAAEWAPHGITVNAIGPAWFPTEMTHEGFEDEARRRKVELATPMGRLGRPDEIQSALLFLCAPSSSYVTGITVYVDGGWTSW